jgi:hypothetical protein
MVKEFLVLYDEPRLIHTYDKGAFYEQEGHSLVVQANDEEYAFIAAFDCLTRRGHMVRTMKPGETVDDLFRSQEQQRAYNPEINVAVISGLTLDQMQRVWAAGVPIIGGRGDTRKMTHIVSLQAYDLDQSGFVAYDH